MLKLHKDKGLSLIELMVAVTLGLILIFSMLAFYSISQKNLMSYTAANQEQRSFRKIMNLLSKDIENTGAFECARNNDVFTSPSGAIRFPRNIISLGADFSRKQIIFVHPVTEEHLYKSLGMIDIQGTGNNLSAVYEPIEIAAGCGQEASSTIYIGTTLLEVIPLLNDSDIITSVTGEKKIIKDSISAFVSLSYIQARQEANSSTKASLKALNREYYDDSNFRHSPVGSTVKAFATTIKNNSIQPLYQPSMEDATVLFLSNDSKNAAQAQLLPFGKNEVDIFLGFSPDGRFSSVPNQTMTDLKDGGWINPFLSETNYNLIVDKADTSIDATLINQALHRSNSTGQDISNYPLNEAATKQIRAIKFTFTFDAGTDEERVLTRVIRFKNTHLMKIGDEPDA